MVCFTLGFTRKIPGFPMVNSWFPGLDPLANAWKPGFYQDSRKPTCFQWDRGKCIFPPGIYQGKTWETGAVTRPEFQLFPSYIPGIPLGYCLVFGGKSAFSQVLSWVNTRGFPGFFLVFTRGRTGVTENLVFTWGKPVFQVRPGKTW